MKNRIKQRQRQQRSIWKMETGFKVGDIVFFDAWCEGKRAYGVGKIDYMTTCGGFVGVDEEWLLTVNEIRHATTAEIAAGYRIDHCVEATKKVELFGNSEELEVLDLADVGPNTKVSEL